MKMNKKGQINPKIVFTLGGFIAGYVLIGQINSSFSIVGGIICAFLAWKFL
jgi:hypothetical protein